MRYGCSFMETVTTHMQIYVPICRSMFLLFKLDKTNSYSKLDEKYKFLGFDRRETKYR